MSLEGGGYLVNQKSSPQLSKNFHEHNGADILNASGGVFGNRDKPFPFPGGGNVTVSAIFCSEAFIGLCNHLGLLVLKMFVLDGPPEEFPCLDLIRATNFSSGGAWWRRGCKSANTASREGE